LKPVPIKVYLVVVLLVLQYEDNVLSYITDNLEGVIISRK